MNAEAEAHQRLTELRLYLLALDRLAGDPEPRLSGEDVFALLQPAQCLAKQALAHLERVEPA